MTDVEALVKAAEAPPQPIPAIEVGRALPMPVPPACCTLRDYP
jgi:hypothetical protein